HRQEYNPCLFAQSLSCFSPTDKSLNDCSLAAAHMLVFGSRQPGVPYGFMPIQYTIFIIAVVALGLFMGYSAFASARLLLTWRPDKNPLLTRAENVLRLVLIALCLLLGLL